MRRFALDLPAVIGTGIHVAGTEAQIAEAAYPLRQQLLAEQQYRIQHSLYLRTMLMVADCS